MRTFVLAAAAAMLALPALAQGIWPTNPSNGMPTQGTVIGPNPYPNLSPWLGRPQYVPQQPQYDPGPLMYPRERFDPAITNAPAVYPAYPQYVAPPCCYYPQYGRPYYRRWR